MRESVKINRENWNLWAQSWSERYGREEQIQAILQNPSGVWDPAIWKMIQSALPSMEGKRICIPSSGDNHAAFAFASMGAQVTSCDISVCQLENARRIAQRHGWSITFVEADTMELAGVPSDTYDLVFTSNGVHVWIEDLPAMYRSIARVMKLGGAYIAYEIHPFQRPFDERTEGACLRVIKPYDATGPFVDDGVKFHWRLEDILNAMACAGLQLTCLREIPARVDDEEPFWQPANQNNENDHAGSREEIEKMYDWRHNPLAALPQFLGVQAQKPLAP